MDWGYFGTACPEPWRQRYLNKAPRSNKPRVLSYHEAMREYAGRVARLPNFQPGGCTRHNRNPHPLPWMTSLGEGYGYDAVFPIPSWYLIGITCGPIRRLEHTIAFTLVEMPIPKRILDDYPFLKDSIPCG